MILDYTGVEKFKWPTQYQAEQLAIGASITSTGCIAIMVGLALLPNPLIVSVVCDVCYIYTPEYIYYMYFYRGVTRVTLSDRLNSQQHCKGPCAESFPCVVLVLRHIRPDHALHNPDADASQNSIKVNGTYQ